MTVTFTGVDEGSFANQIPAPEDDEDVDGASVQQVAEAAANQDKHIYDLAIAGASITRAMDTDLVNETTGVVDSAGGGTLGVEENMGQTIRVPNGATITAVTMYIDPPNGVVLPGNRPTLTFRKVNIVTGVAAGIAGPFTDPNDTIGTYRVHHGFGFTGLAEVVDRATSVYLVRITGEAGGNDSPITVYGCGVTYTTSGVPDKGGN